MPSSPGPKFTGLRDVVCSAVRVVRISSIDHLGRLLESVLMKTCHSFIVVVEGLEDEAAAQLKACLAGIGEVMPTTLSLGLAKIETSASTVASAVVRLPRLTARQQQVLPLVLSGLSNKRIARVLGLSHFTVRNHITCLFVAFGVGSRAELKDAMRNTVSADWRLAA
jgi:DNA-binding NarL/FixJ family response regulator